MAGISIDEAVEEMRFHIRRDVAAGFASVGEIVSTAVEIVSGDIDEKVVRPRAEQLAKAAVEEHIRAQESWPAVTDCDRLDAAFAELEEKGVVCRQNFSCCGNCGAAEIQDEMAAEQEKGREVRGYAFYHMQDTESAVEGDGLYLAYGSVVEGEEAALRIAREVVEHLERHSLATDWDGSWKMCIGVRLDWKRRR